MTFEDIYLYGVIAAFVAFGVTLFAVSIWSRGEK
jgi:ABC-type transport system involved in cytochrome c biogenesis permease subunit